MAETLLALLLVTTSAKGSSLVFRWPAIPIASPRLARARPEESDSLSHLDNPWKASHPEHAAENAKAPEHDYGCNPDYCWQRSNALRDRSLSFRHSSHFSAGRVSPVRDRAYSLDKVVVPDEYDHLLGYSVDFLATLLCPQRSMCHQKFELVVDDLAFIGHPVCADADGAWRFQPEKFKAGRSRETREPTNSVSPHSDGPTSSSPENPPSQSAWLHTFHFALVLDLPDPSSSASGNLSKYFNILYEQIAFILAAVLYQEQVLSNFVEKECDVLSALKESCISKGEPFSKYVSQAFEVSSIAPAMKSIYEAIKNSKMAYISINNLPLELQLPPFLDSLLDSQEDPEVDLTDPSDNDEALNWGEELSLGWKLPTMTPWKSLLLLDVDNEMDPHQILDGPQENSEDKALAEGLVKFLDTASAAPVTLSLSEMANELDWDLESQVYPIVRWLVLHRRAKVVDTVHPTLKTVFTLPPKFGKPLSQLTSEFQETFSHPSIPPLPRILATVSTSMSKQTDNHFFASVVHSKEFIPLYHKIVLWMLKRDMLVALHLRIRLVATSELKARVKDERNRKLAGIRRDFAKRDDGSNPRSTSQHDADGEALSPNALSKNATFFLSPKTARRFARSKESDRSSISELDFRGGEGVHGFEEGLPGSEVDSNSELDEEDSGWDTTEDHVGPSMINDPGKATPMQRRWLSAMSKGKQTAIARRFERINQYFDGKKSDDEILYRAEISRRQLREILHHYEEYLQTFLHPS